MRRLLPLVLLVATHALAGPDAILVPFDSGTYGRWSAEVWVRNEADHAVNLYPEQCYFIGLQVPCNFRIDVPAKTTMLLDTRPSDDLREPGLFLYVPEGEAGKISVGLRIRALPDGPETEIPTVHFANMRVGRTELLNIPLRAGTTPTLRVYAQYAVNSLFVVRVYRIAGGGAPDQLLFERSFQQVLPTDGPPGPFLFDFSSALTDAAKLGATRVRVSIEPTFPGGEFRYWPLVTVTDDLTRHVTTVTPQ
ncbi:MAG TPA: hypothetical protein VJ276_24065 [Thermoanaerobaculia bacterium]|nr:hypothetical protein [Thermoanaerobaculia bacterium]